MENQLLEEVKKHFNEPIICGFEIGRVYGYAEDEQDCYIIVKFPNGARRDKVYHTMVGGYTFLNLLSQQGYVRSTGGEDWTDLTRLDSALEFDGCPKIKDFIIDIQIKD